MSTAGPGPQRRVRVRVTGTVQGVGFRPHVHRLAGELGLSGYVLNDERGVLLEAEGPPVAVAAFLERLRADAPPLAEVEEVSAEELPATGDDAGFSIAESTQQGEPLALISPDVATCDACLSELFDPADRRYRYPFINCTDCGPRFTIVRGVPYDRPLTTMAGFEMCSLCQAEYDDPTDRRFHAQPNACPICGPAVTLSPTLPKGSDPFGRAEGLLRDGGVLAIKGIGGYHLACRADREDAVAALRARKHREEKPFALMAPGLEAARALVELTPVEEALLLGRARPIVVARRRADANVAPSVAPGAPDLGVMLAYSPLHHILLADAGVPLVMTSGNVSDEPIAYQDADAAERLGVIADLILTHDRPIHTRTDDSVVRSLGGVRAAPLMLRRSRGYVPQSLPLPMETPRALLACGAEQKSTFCVAKGRRAWVSHHIGDLENWETLRSYREGVEHFERLFAVEPEVLVHDLHPEYLATKYALERDGVELVGVQHHHAHLAACLAEHGVQSQAVGAIYDGTGFGDDGTVWGGEVLVGDLAGSRRAASLLAVRMPGGERAIREPWRMACSWLVAAERPARPARLEGVDAGRWAQIAELARSGLASPLTSSMGRLFDAVAALCGVRAQVSYEGQAAVELEAVADVAERGRYPLPLDGPVLDARETVLAVLADTERGVPVEVIAARFHNGVAAATAEACTVAAETAGTGVVALSGGVFQNHLLVERTVSGLAARGLTALIPERLPPNDGGISYGQAAAATARMS